MACNPSLCNANQVLCDYPDTIKLPPVNTITEQRNPSQHLFLPTHAFVFPSLFFKEPPGFSLTTNPRRKSNTFLWPHCVLCPSLQQISGECDPGSKLQYRLHSQLSWLWHWKQLQLALKCEIRGKHSRQTHLVGRRLLVQRGQLCYGQPQPQHRHQEIHCHILLLLPLVGAPCSKVGSQTLQTVVALLECSISTYRMLCTSLKQQFLFLPAIIYLHHSKAAQLLSCKGSQWQCTNDSASLRCHWVLKRP